MKEWNKPIATDEANPGTGILNLSIIGGAGALAIGLYLAAGVAAVLIVFGALFMISGAKIQRDLLEKERHRGE